MNPLINIFDGGYADGMADKISNKSLIIFYKSESPFDQRRQVKKSMKAN